MKVDFDKTSGSGSAPQVPRRILEVFIERGEKFLTAAELKQARAELAKHAELEAIAARWDPQRAKEESRKLKCKFHEDFDGKKLEAARDSLWDAEHGGQMRRQATQAVVAHFCDKLAGVCITALENELAATVKILGEIVDHQRAECALYGVTHHPGGDVFDALALHAQMLRARIEAVKRGVQCRFMPEPPESLLKTAFATK